MKIWSFAWRVVWVFSAVMVLYSAITSDSGIFGVCLMSVIVNIPVYLYRRYYRDAETAFNDALDWEFHPVRTLILGLLFAPLLTVAMILQFSVQVLQILFGRW